VNPLIITIIIALATFIVSIFGASWLNQQAMNKRIDDLRSYLGARFDAVDAQFSAVNNRITHLEQRVERIGRQLDQIFKPSLPRP
jgi:hypothetical protein